MDMKRYYYNIYKVFSIVALAFAAFGYVSCTEKEPEIVEEPKFPALVTKNDIKPGEKIILSFIPNMDWTITIPEESLTWFWIDDKFDKHSKSGKASRIAQRVVIQTTPKESFALRSCDVKMTMGGKTKVVASYTLKAKGSVLDVNPAVYSENGFSFADGDYVYDNKRLTSEDVIEFVWDENERKFVFPIKVKSNFEWDAKWPEWVIADLPGEREGNVSVLLEGNIKHLPYEASEGVISFNLSGEQVSSFKVAIPGAKDIFIANMGGYASLKFDHAAYFRADIGVFSKEPVAGSIYGPKECRVEVLELKENGYVATDDNWLKVTVDSWDDNTGSDVLQSRGVQISASTYSGNEDREAMILLLPATAPKNLADIFESDMINVKEEYAQYAYPVTQTARPANYFTFDYGISQRDLAGLDFSNVASALPPNSNLTFAEGADNWQYEMTYRRSRAASKSAVTLTVPYHSIEIYDVEGNQIAEDKLSEHWLGYTQLGDELYGQVTMSEEYLPIEDVLDENGQPVLDEQGKPVQARVEQIDGYVVFKNKIGEALCSVHCFYIKESFASDDCLEEAADEVFQDKAAAAAAGVTAYRITDGPTFQKYIESDAPIYLLTCTKDNQTFIVNTSTACESYNSPGKSQGPRMVTVDNQIYYDFEYYTKYLDPWKEADQAYKDAINNGADPNTLTKPVYPDPNIYYRGTEGILSFGETAFENRTYPGYSEFRMKMPAPEEGAEPESVYTEVIMFGNNSTGTKFIFICTLDLRDASLGK